MRNQIHIFPNLRNAEHVIISKKTVCNTGDI